MKNIYSLPGILNDKAIRELCLPPVTRLHFQDNKDHYFHKVETLTTTQSAKEVVEKYRTGSIYPQGLFVGNDPHPQERIDEFEPMITPFHPEQIRVNEAGQRIMSYGLSSMGYDVTLAPKFKIFTNIHTEVIDPLNMSERNYVDVEAILDGANAYVILPPNSYLLSYTNEYFNMPPDVLAMCLGKSTGARAGLMVNVTPIEPGFKGTVVIELANLTPSPMRVYANMGIAQFMFFRANERCEVSYGDRAGKYQGQQGIQTAIV